MRARFGHLACCVPSDDDRILKGLMGGIRTLVSI
jgi:hypothetical protein